MYKYLFFIFTIISISAFSQRTKKNAKKGLIESPKEVSHEHFKDFKLIMDMLDSAKKVTYLRYNMRAVERVETGYSTSISKIKLQTHSRKSYLVNTETKLEVLYNESEMGTKALVKPHIFPYFTMSLDPRGNLMRKNQHFTILDLGFDFTAKTIAIALSKEKDQIAKHLTMVGKAEKNKMNCHLVVYENTEFSYYDYTVGHKETISSIAGKFTVNDYMLRCKNKLYDEYGYLKEGSVIKVPTFYCKKAVFYVDEKTMLPVSIAIYDEVGLFESYDFYNLEVNKPIPNEEFKRNYKGYGF